MLFSHKKEDILPFVATCIFLEGISKCPPRLFLKSEKDQHCMLDVEYKKNSRDIWVAQLVTHLFSAQVMIPGSWDRAPCWGSLLSGEPASPFPLLHTLLVLSLPVREINK